MLTSQQFESPVQESHQACLHLVVSGQRAGDLGTSRLEPFSLVEGGSGIITYHMFGHIFGGYSMIFPEQEA